MKIYDISRELFSTPVYPGDTIPTYLRAVSYEAGDVYSLTDINICAHSATHADAPYHFIRDGKTIDAADIYAYVGRCRVVTAQDGVFTSETAAKTLSDGDERVLIRGGILTDDGADAVIGRRIRLVGVEGVSVSDPDAPMAVHVRLLSHEIAILEGLDLSCVPDGEYFLSALPIKLGGSDGAPVRAVLIDGITETK